MYNMTFFSLKIEQIRLDQQTTSHFELHKHEATPQRFCTLVEHLWPASELKV